MTPLSARSSYDNENRARSSRVMELPKVADNLPRVASEKQHGMESENTCNFLIFATFEHYIWKAIAPRSKHSGTPKLELEVQRVCTIDGSPQPLLVIYTYGASASDYTCRPNIHYLLYSSLMPMYYHALLFCLTNYMRKCANKLHTLIYVGCIFALWLNIGLHYTKLIAAT